MIERLNKLWWYRIPIKASKISSFYAVAFADGFYITAWSRVGAYTPFIAAGVGFLIGWLHPAYTYTYSLTLIAIMMLISSLGAALGIWTLLGYAFGDFLLHPHQKYDGLIETFFRTQVPLLISYALLAVLLVSVPLVALIFRQQTVPNRKKVSLETTLKALFQALLQAIFVYVWVQSIPILIRPLYTWRGQSPDVAAIQPLQEQGHNLVILAAILGVIRVLLEAFATSKPRVLRRKLQLQRKLRKADSYLLLPLWSEQILKAAVDTLIFSGMLHTIVEAILFGAILTLLLFLREGLILPMALWRSWISRVPILLRFIVAILLNYYLSAVIIGALWDNYSNSASFMPIIVATVVGITVFSLLIPNSKVSRSDKITFYK